EAITRGTIHALCLALLREHTEAAGLRKGFGVADELYQKVILGRLHVPLEQRGPLLNRFGRHRVQAYELTADDARLYREYTGWLAQRNMLDFDDLVTHAATLMRTRGDVGDAIAARWDYLLVDEFQDVNAVQYDLLKRLAEPHGNFFAVGDDEQSIFTWTGADPYVLVRFGRDYGIGRPRHTLSPAQDRRVPRGAARSCGDSLPAGARALARRRRRHQVRDRRAADRA